MLFLRDVELPGVVLSCGALLVRDLVVIRLEVLVSNELLLRIEINPVRNLVRAK